MVDRRFGYSLTDVNGMGRREELMQNFEKIFADKWKCNTFAFELRCSRFLPGAADNRESCEIQELYP